MGYPNVLEKFNNYIPIGSNSTLNTLTLTTDVCIKRSDNSNRLIINGGDGVTSAHLALHGKDHDGAFWLVAVDETNGRKELIGRPNGNLTWRGSNVITTAGGTMNGTLWSTSNKGLLANASNTGYMDVGYSYDDRTGGLIAFRGLEYSSTNSAFNGAVEIIARNTSEMNTFRVLTNGQLTCSKGEIIPLTTKYTSGTAYSSTNSGYRKYSDGFIEQWGCYKNTSSSGTVTMPTAFGNTNYMVVISQGEISSNDTGGWGYGVALNPSKTTTTFTYSVQGSCYIYWYACGY